MPEDLQDPENPVSESSAFPNVIFGRRSPTKSSKCWKRAPRPGRRHGSRARCNSRITQPPNRAYRGGNALHLMAVGARKGFDDPRWLTYRQAQENGWQVRKGEKGSQIEFWQFELLESRPKARKTIRRLTGT